MFLWLIISIPVIVTLLILMSNQANLSQAPGLLPRLKIFTTTNRAEVSREPVLAELQSPQFKQTADKVFAALPAIVESLGWEIKEINEDKLRLRAVVSTPLWKFKDDVVINVLAGADHSYLLASSQSRIGRADLAANSRHLQVLLEKLRHAGL